MSRPPASPSGTALARVRLLAAALACLGPMAVQAQTAGPPVTAPPNETPPSSNAPAPTPPAAETTPAATSARAAAAASLSRSVDSVDSTPANASLAPRPAVVTVVGSGNAAGGGTRVLKAPSACTPKTNSLDCVAESGQAGQGANVSSRVRNSVIGEVGAGRAATEGGGAARREGPCVPQAGKLTCE